MGGGHLLCLIMKPHFFFHSACLIKKKCVLSYIPAFQFSVLAYSVFFSSLVTSNVSSPEYFFVLFLFFVFLFSESELMRKGPVVIFSFARISFFYFLSLLLFSSLLSFYFCDGEPRREKDLGMAVGGEKRVERYFVCFGVGEL
ncbi:hypothetical protein GGI42DRAFT_114604 [Trichoderma sp. SZMC 28013]